IQAETVLAGLGAGLHQAVRSGLCLVLAPGSWLICASTHSGPGGMASEPPPAGLRKAFLAQSTLLESTLERLLSGTPTELPPCPPGRNHPLCPCSGRGGGRCSTPSFPSSSTFSVFSSGVRKPQSQGRVGLLI
uniref:Uncharacterized protein n=1 Tax=Saimiri boliviensis boliviensis TaxID=39432 RepID=A0A2K6SX03_SAIBB